MAKQNLDGYLECKEELEMDKKPMRITLYTNCPLAYEDECKVKRTCPDDYHTCSDYKLRMERK